MEKYLFRYYLKYKKDHKKELLQTHYQFSKTALIIFILLFL